MQVFEMDATRETRVLSCEEQARNFISGKCSLLKGTSISNH